ncbi:10905_t:CDS:2, partial [Acaulospora colombiana]
ANQITKELPLFGEFGVPVSGIRAKKRLPANCIPGQHSVYASQERNYWNAA